MKLITKPSQPEHQQEKRTRGDVEQYRVTQAAIAKIRKAGLPKPEQYIDAEGNPLNPRLKKDLARTDNASLGRMMTEFTAAAEYASYAAAIADIDRSVEKSILEYTEAKVRLTKTGTEQKKRDKTQVDPHVIEARQRFLEKDALATLTATIARSYERAISTISREITRRSNEMERST